ncbi:MAG: metal-dependent hydrolase [Myxococcales bacterium]|nr:metal-dependent hydrolase [Myxococcales bacterium]
MTRRAAPALVLRARMFDFSGVPRHWCGGDAVRSRLFDAFSTLLPVGERFFIEALRRAAVELGDPELDELIEQFVRQEALHSREHRRYNERLREEGIDLDRWDRSLKRTMWRVLQLRDPRIPLAITVAVEHLTAAIGRAVLDGRVLDDAEPIVLAFWSWHSAEEIEHKSVAFEVYERLGGGPGLRRAMMGWGLLLLAIRLGARLVDLLRRDGVLFERATYRAGARLLRGAFGQILTTEIAAYFRRDFHPWNRDDYHLVEAWERR